MTTFLLPKERLRIKIKKICRNEIRNDKKKCKAIKTTSFLYQAAEKLSVKASEIELKASDNSKTIMTDDAMK